MKIAGIDYDIVVFPFTIEAVETASGTHSPMQYLQEFRKAFVARAKPRTYWYAYDVIIHSRTRVEFIAYDMRDTVYGGIGDHVDQFEVEVDPTVTADSISRRVVFLASEARRIEHLDAEDRIIEGYAQMIRKQIDRED